MRRLISALHRWAESGWAGAATATWELLQSSILPGPSAVVFAPLAVADPGRAPRLAMYAASGAIVGGWIAYLIGTGLGAGTHPLLSAVGVNAERLASTEALFVSHGWLLVFLSMISPLSSKLTCIAAGAFGLAVPEFLGVLIVGRVLKYAVFTVALRFVGEHVSGKREEGRGKR